MAMAVLSRAKCDFREATEVFHQEVDLDAVLRLQRHIQQRRQTQSTVYLSGVGKSMNLAAHIADMLKSIGIKAVVIDPTKALHGDSGMICDSDMLMTFSKSGGTKEVVRLVRQLQANESQCTTIACVCNPKCDLVRYCDDAVVLPVHAEVDPGWNLVPTVSSSFFLNMGNLLVSSILLDDNYQLTQYAKSHPGGSIGKAAVRSISNCDGPIASTGNVSTPARNLNVPRQIGSGDRQSSAPSVSPSVMSTTVPEVEGSVAPSEPQTPLLL